MTKSVYNMICKDYRQIIKVIKALYGNRIFAEGELFFPALKPQRCIDHWKYKYKIRAVNDISELYSHKSVLLWPKYTAHGVWLSRVWVGNKIK